MQNIVKPLFRNFFELYYKKNNTYSVLFGPLRGMRVSYNPSLSFLELMGLTELTYFAILKKILFEGGLLKKRHFVFADVGANMGLYSLWFSRLTSTITDSQIYAFEPVPTTVQTLIKNLELNKIKNVRVVREALSDKVGKCDILLTGNSHTSYLDTTGKNTEAVRTSVPTTTLDSFFFGKENLEPPDLIKVDIEGAGTLALDKCDKCIAAKRPFFFIESHTPDEDAAIGRLAIRNHYVAYRVTNTEWVKNLTHIHPQKDGIWGKVLLIPQEFKKKFTEILHEF